MGILPQSVPVSKADVCLVSPATRAQGRRPPIALMQLAAYLDREGVKTEIADIKKDDFIAVTPEEEKIINNEIIKVIKKCKPSLIGITAYCHEINEVIELAKTIKKKFKNIKIVVGGVQSSLFPKSFLFRGSPIDIVVFGEGEITLTEIAKNVLNKKPLDTILGTAYFKNGKIKKTGWRPLINNLDELPFPAFDKVNMDFYIKPNIYGIRWIPLSCFYIFTSRGCPGMCTFCVNTNLWKAGGCNKMIRFRSVRSVVDEIEFLVCKYKIDSLYIYDDSFIISRERTLDFCKELKKRKINIIWGCEARVDKVDDGLIREMKEAGCVQIDFGVESGSQKCLDTVKKNITVKQIEDAFRVCNKYGMRTFANIMFNFPGETEEDIKQTWEMAERIKATDYSFAILTPFPGTNIYESLNLNLTRKQHDIFKSASLWMVDKRFRLAAHDLELNKVAVEANLHFNSVRHYFSPKILQIYWKVLLNSKRKREYILALFEIGGFAVKHILPRILLKNLTVDPKKSKQKTAGKKL